METSIKVNTATAADAVEWDAALSHLAGNSFYHRFAWRTINGQSFRHPSVYLIARENSRISGLLPLTLISSRLFGRILCSMPFVNLGGPCANDARTSELLLQQAKVVARQTSSDYLELRCRNQFECDLPVSLRKVSMVVPLRPEPEQLWTAFTPKHRRNIRRAQKNDLEVKSGGRDLLPEFYQVMEQSWRNLGTPFYARDYFDRVLTTFPEETRIFVCRRHGKPLAVALNGYCAGTVEGLWNGSIAEGRNLQANYVLYWEMLRDACLRGYSKFHLGRSTTESGAEEFKRKWNPEMQQLYWYSWRPDGKLRPALSVENPRFRLAIAVWRRLPMAITRVIGPPIARCIP